MTSTSVSQAPVDLTAAIESSQLFASLPLSEPIQRAVAELGYATMTPIQAQAIPVVVLGKDVMGAAQTGTGKTAAFALPLLQRMLKHENTSTSPARHPVRALVLLPTRELADQVATAVAKYAKYTQLRSAVVYGGVDIKPQALAVRAGVEVLVATPGRLLDHIESKNVALNQVEYVVLDEADRMLDIGFLPDLQRILSFLPKQRTTLLFSATFSPEIKRLASSYLQDPVVIEVARPNSTASTVEQIFMSVEDDDKRQAVCQIVRERGVTQAIVFVNSKLGCARLARSLERDGLVTTALHGDKSQDERLKALDSFKKGEVQILVATDVAARGLDIPAMPCVINFDLPFNAEDYIHRIGRTGRAGASGLAVSFVSRSDARNLADIEKLIKRKADLVAFEPHPEAARRRQSGSDFNSVRLGESRAVREPSARRYEDNSRSWGQSDSSARQDSFTSAPRAPRERRSVPVDPFFNTPYEAAAPSAALSTPAWDAPQSGIKKSVSSNIRPKRRVAALFVTPAPAPVQVSEVTDTVVL